MPCHSFLVNSFQTTFTSFPIFFINQYPSMLEALEFEWIIVGMCFFWLGLEPIRLVRVSTGIVFAPKRKLRLVLRVHRALCEGNWESLNKNANFFYITEIILNAFQTCILRQTNNKASLLFVFCSLKVLLYITTRCRQASNCGRRWLPTFITSIKQRRRTIL